MEKHKIGLDARTRDNDGEIRQKRDDTKLKTIRNTYGKGVASGTRSDAKLGTVLKQKGKSSLSALIKN